MFIETLEQFQELQRVTGEIAIWRLERADLASRETLPAPALIEGDEQRYAVNGRNMHLSERTTADYEHRGELGDRTRRGIHEDARILATQCGRSVDIYSSDGIMFAQIHADECI